MLDRERSLEPSQLGTSFVRPERARSVAPMPVGVRGGYVADEVGMGKTLCAISVILANPAPPAGVAAPMLADGVRITVWYAQGDEASAAQEAAAPACPQIGIVRWSNYEGMMVRFDEAAVEEERELWVDAKEDDWAWGDWATPALLVPSRDALLHDWIRDCKGGFQTLQHYSNAIAWLRATLVIAPVSLLGQWADEIRDFAPGLTVVTWHACAHTKGGSLWTTDQAKVLASFATADVILTTSGMAAKLLGYRFHRIIVDEVHTDDVKNAFLFHARRPGVGGVSGFRSTAQANYECSASRVWLLTGTPLTRGVEDLALGGHLLGHADFGLRLLSARLGPELLASMKQLCIRHKKTQVIKGSAALSLPASQTKIVWLQMTHNERQLYRLAAEKDANQVPKIEREGAKDFFLEMALRCRRQACSNIYKFSGQERAFTEPQALLMYDKTRKAGTEFTFEYAPKLSECTKLRALLTDLHVLRNTEPNCMAVVFTHHRETHSALVALLKQNGRAAHGVAPFQVYEIHGAMDNTRRHDAVREFQGRGKGGGGPKVLVVTLRVGAVGMTLTSANRVYLFEPAFNPAAEVQAAGRIHRLGQTKDVLITRFVYRDSIEENIVKLHEAINAGSVKLSDGMVPPTGARILTRGAP